MPQGVSVATIDRLRLIASGGDPARAYQELSRLGYNYAELARGVVTGDTVFGRTAGNFARASAVSQGRSISTDQFRIINRQLFEEYAVALRNSANANGIVTSDINYQTALTFHNRVFTNNGLSPATWTLYEPGRILGAASVQNQWAGLLSNSSSEAVGNFIVLSLKAEFTDYWAAVAWERDVVLAGGGALLDGLPSLSTAPGLGFLPISFSGDQASGVSFTPASVSFSPDARLFAARRQLIIDATVEAIVPLASTILVQNGGTAIDSATAQANLLRRQTAIFDVTSLVDARYNPNAPFRLSVAPADLPPANPTPGSLNFSSFASSFGSTLGRTLGGSNLIIGTVAGSVISAAALSIGQQLFGVNAYPTLSGTIKGQLVRQTTSSSGIFADFGNNLSVALANAGIGAVSSFLTLELGQALGLSGFGAGLFSSAVGGVLNHVVTNAVTGAPSLFSGLVVKQTINGVTTTVSNLNNLVKAGIASFFGQQLAQLVITPKTPAQAVFASLGAAALSIFGGKAIGAIATQVFTKIGVQLGSLGGPVGILVGTFVGFIVGALFGKLFGKPKPRIPTASAETVLQIPNARYVLGTEISANGGDLAFVDTLAVAARDTLNGIIQLIAGGPGVALFVSNSVSPTQTYGLTGSQIYVRLGIGAAQTNVSSGDQAVDRGVLFALPLTQIIGGNIILKRAIANSGSPSVTALLGDLQTAKDYETYLRAAPAIDAAISAGYNSLSAADKAFYNANKSFVTRALSRTEVALNGTDQAFYNANQTQVDRIISTTQVSSFAAAYIVTLARAAELNLDQFGRSDFYGGAQGFLQSFNFAAVGTGVHYEDAAFSLSGGNLTITASGLASAGAFSLLPQASANGRSVTITGFGANVGYTVQSIGVRSSGNDFEIAPANGAAVTVSAGTPGYNGGYYGNYYYQGTDGGDDIIIGGSGNDNLSSGAGDVWIDGAAGHDIIYGGAGRNVLIGGDGVDQIFGGAGDDYIAGGAGNDYIQPWIGGPAPGGLFGGDGNDIIVGGGGLDGVFGENGDDVLIVDEDGGATFDYYDGGVGSDTASFERFTSAVNFNLTTGRGSGYTAVTYGDGFVAIENVTGSNLNDIIYGDEVANTLKGLGGNDQLYGGEGNDIIEGGEGVDIVNGGGGTNTASYLGSSAGVYVNLATGTTIGGDATGDVLSSIQNLIGSNYGDELAGDAGVNIISTGVGDDYIDATTGADTYNGGDGFDTLDYSLATFTSLNVTLNSASGYSYHYNSAGTLVYQSLTSVEQVIGTSANDYFSSAGTNLNITWDGNGGSDYISGGTGSDTYVYGQGYGVVSISDSKSASNTIRFKSGTTFDQLWAANSGGTLQLGIRGAAGYIQAYSNAATVGNNVIKFLDLGGIAQVDVTQVNAVYAGSDVADTLYGAATTSNLIFANNGNDTIYGASGALSQKGSIIAGGLGNDYIVTSSGDDQFLFERGNGRDTIVDGGGQNSIIFGSTVSAEDVIYQVVGNDLYVGIKDLTNEALTASQVADYLVVANGGVIRINQNTGAQTRYTTITVQAGGNTIDTTKADVNFTLQYYTPPGGGGGGGGGGCANCQIPPIILDLTGDGLQITPVGQSDIVTRDANGNILRTSWVGPANGILAFDRNGDGKINNTADISFVQDKHGATTDLEGLAGRDSNADGVLDASDEFFSKLVVWVDANQDGRAKKSEVKTLSELGIVSISLKPLATGFDDSDTLDTVIRNTTTFTRIDGSIGTGYDVALARQLLNGDPASAVGADVDLSAVAEFGQLKNHLAPLPGRTIGLNTIGASSAPVDADFSEAGGSLSAAAAARFATILDPVKNKAFKDLIANGTVGEEFLDQIRTTKARADDGAVLIGRASRDPKSRLQAIVVDFNRNGADLVDPTKSRAFVDAARDGTVSQIGWVRPSDGVLAFDRNDDGAVDARSEISFLGDAPNARTSLQGLRSFDSNGDGVLSSADSSFAKFLIWRDVNGNGFSEAGETQSLAQAAVKSITLDTSNLRPDRGVGSSNDVLGVSKITFTDDSERAIYDVALGFADSKEADAKAPSQSAQSARPNSGPVPTAAVSNDSVGLATNDAPTLLASANVIGRSRGSLDGPAGAIVEATSTSVNDNQWWRDASIVGQSYANLANAIAGQNSALGANQSSFAGAGATDAATLQRLLLLRQNIASLQPSTGGSAAIFNRGAANDLSPLAATALRPVPQASQQAGAGG